VEKTPRRKDGAHRRFLRSRLPHAAIDTDRKGMVGIMKKQFLEAGRIVGTHGVRGEMRVEPWCDSAEFLKKLKRLYFDEGRTDAGLLASRVHKSLLLVRLAGVESATEADLYRGRVLYLDRNDVRLPKNRYFISDLIGLSVIDDVTGAVYGTVQEVFETGSNNVYRIAGANGAEYLFPAVDEMIAKTDVDGGKLFVRPIPGIFGGEAETITTEGDSADAD